MIIKDLLNQPYDSPTKREVRVDGVIKNIHSLETELLTLNEEQLRNLTTELRARVSSGVELEKILPMAFALVREALKRTVGLRIYDIQMEGAIGLFEGAVLEMRTGEGKTIVALPALFLRALEGKGAHLLTPSDYLARVGIHLAGPAFDYLGLTIGLVQACPDGDPDNHSYIYDKTYNSEDPNYENLRPVTREEAFNADITYGEQNEVGFSFLRDYHEPQVCQPKTLRGLHFAIVDEADSVLIDEARTPLVLTGSNELSSNMENLHIIAQFVESLIRDLDYDVSIERHLITLNECCIDKIERLVHSLFSDELPEEELEQIKIEYYRLVNLALKAKELYFQNIDYLVQNEEIVLINQDTGRPMHGRRFSEGLHQALEAKEGLAVLPDHAYSGTITIQSLFTKYPHLAGMTGTAATDRREFTHFFNLEVLILPTNVEHLYRSELLTTYEAPSQIVANYQKIDPTIRPSSIDCYRDPKTDKLFFRRCDLPDHLFLTKQARNEAVVNEIIAVASTGRPVLICADSVITAEEIYNLLLPLCVSKSEEITIRRLTAKDPEQEAEIIAQAGNKNTVTISTDMAGRGVDIILSQDVRDAGGLHVISLGLPEARRVEYQRRGRAGRQGDPGTARSFFSLDDQTAIRYGGNRLSKLIELFKISGRIVVTDHSGSTLASSQKFEHRLFKIYRSIQRHAENLGLTHRRDLLNLSLVVERQREAVYSSIDEVRFCSSIQLWYLITQLLTTDLPTIFQEDNDTDLSNLDLDVIKPRLVTLLENPQSNALIRNNIMRIISQHWGSYLAELETLEREISISARTRQQDPLVEFRIKSSRLFQWMTASIRREIVIYISLLQKTPSSSETN